MDNFVVVDPVIIGMGKKDWKEVKDIPSNMTLLGGYIKISPKSLCTFERKPASGSNTKKSGGNTYSSDTVYFTFAMLCDVEPSKLISWILAEWMRACCRPSGQPRDTACNERSMLELNKMVLCLY
jgi:hypothetical protein